MALNSTHLAASSHALHRKRFGNDLFMFYSCIRKVGAERCSQGVVFYFLFVILYLSLYFWLDEMKPTCTPAERVTSFSSHSWMLVIFFYQKTEGCEPVSDDSYFKLVISLYLTSPKFKTLSCQTESQSLPFRDIFLYRTSFAMKGVHVHAFGLTVS